MKIIRLSYLIILVTFTYSCAPLEQIYSHKFDSGTYKLKVTGAESEKIYLDLTDDSVTVYPLKKNIQGITDASVMYNDKISSVVQGNPLYNALFVRTSADVDLSTVLLKFRPAMVDVQPQLNANVNGILYAGFRKDFFRFKIHTSPLGNKTAFVRHTGFDMGLFAGIGITPVTPTTTANRTVQEYDGIVFQKGFSAFATYEDMSVGIAVGFDNLTDNNRSIWIYNQKPWIGIVIGIANF